MPIAEYFFEGFHFQTSADICGMIFYLGLMITTRRLLTSRAESSLDELSTSRLSAIIVNTC